MIQFTALNKFEIQKEDSIREWIQFVLDQELKELGEINYVFCDDDYLLEMNIKELKHNTLTDIISLDYTVGDLVSGDIFISVERVRENAGNLGIAFKEELYRVMVHGILHYCGYKDKSAEEQALMREKEDYYLSLRTFNAKE